MHSLSDARPACRENRVNSQQACRICPQRRCAFRISLCESKVGSDLTICINDINGQILILNCMFSLRHLPDETVAAESPRKRMLKNIPAMNSKVLIERVMNVACNTPLGFIHRFRALIDRSGESAHGESVLHQGHLQCDGT
ncbi:hypothetical protein O6H91_16G034600 [Diphasiastrum complanatum]|uniref:Uncharacterized protein n=1 Tax=Diphasiastrum complanatum TaxID=34168 RepID=A0ACC2BBC2_DIPCM|nr:hypothetical protein O6H91_16G034600 [Diphasiastrum complanatum]